MPKIESFKTKEEYTEWYRNYRNINRDKIREYNKNYNKLWRHKNGYFKDDVRKKLFYAIKEGIVKKGNCQICGNSGAEGHHFDYSEPLKVVWLCPLHHKDMHRK